MDWKAQLRSRAVSLLQDPRVGALLQDPRVVSGVVEALKLRSKVEQNLAEAAQRLTKALNLASASELQELRRAVSRLERQLEHTRQEQAEIAADTRALS
jgi:hypothetical protein